MTNKTIFLPEYRQMIDRIVKMRKDRGFSQRDLALKMNVPHCFIGRVETYERRLDIMETIYMLQTIGLENDDIKRFLQALVK